MNREVHVRFWEGLAVRFRWATQLVGSPCPRVGDTTFIEARISWSWLEGQGAIFKKDRRKPQLCTSRWTLPGCIPPGCAPRLYRVNFRPIIAQGVSPRDD